MTDWIDQYTAGLDQRDAREQAHKPYIDAYTKLADRTAALQASEPPASASEATGDQRVNTPVRGKSAPQTKDAPSNSDELLARLRSDLASTQKARSTLQTQVDELSTSLKTAEQQSKSSSTQVAQLTKQKTDLERKLRDRDEELKGKGRLVEDAHDEMVALGLQLNVAEEKSERLGKENKDLVDRWMKRMGEEADQVNRDSRWE